MAERRVPLLVLGLGNLLCRDDGLGVAAVSLLTRRWRAPAGVRVLDGGTLGLALLPWLEDAERVILVDAIRLDEPPGTLVRLEGEEEVMRAAQTRLSVHQIGVADLLDGASLRGRLPPRIVLLGVVPESLELGLERSACVEAALPALVDLVVAEASSMGFRFAPLPDVEPIYPFPQEAR